MSETVVQPGSRRTARLMGAPAGRALGRITLRVVADDGTVYLADGGAGEVEPGTYARSYDAPLVEGTYFEVFADLDAPATNLDPDTIVVAWTQPAVAPPAGPSYTTPDALRAELEVDAAALSDAAAVRLIERGEDLVDDLAGARAIDTTTGRKITIADLEPWQALKVQQATLALASVLHADPQAFEPARYGSVSGPDFSKSAPAAGGINPAARIAARRAAALLDAAGLRVLTARAVAGGPEPLPGTRAW